MFGEPSSQQVGWLLKTIKWLTNGIRVLFDRQSEMQAWQVASLQKIAAKEGVELDPAPDFKALELEIDNPPEL